MTAHRKDGSEWNRRDQKELDFHRRVRDGYLLLAASDSSRWFKVDAGRPLHVVQAAIRRHVVPFLEEKGIGPATAGLRDSQGKE